LTIPLEAKQMNAKPNSDDHWTRNVCGNKGFIRRLRETFGDQMFSFNDAKSVYYDHHGMWKERDARIHRKRKRSIQGEYYEGWIFKGTVENAIHKAIHSGEIIYICRGWYMFAGVE